MTADGTITQEDIQLSIDIMEAVQAHLDNMAEQDAEDSDYEEDSPELLFYLSASAVLESAIHILDYCRKTMDMSKR